MLVASAVERLTLLFNKMTTHSLIHSNFLCIMKCQSYTIVLLVTVLNCVNDAIEVNLK